MDSLLHFDRLPFPDPNNNYGSPTVAAEPLKDKYQLRPRALRRLTEPPAEPAPRRPQARKPKPAPLSKYRRKNANARERSRMREINQAFEALRQAIPQMQELPRPPPASEKLTKITTLRLAMKYISSLSAALSGGGSPGAGAPSIDYGELDCLFLESDGESLPLSDHSLLASPDFPDASLSPVDFGDPGLLHDDFAEHSLEPFGEFLLA